MWLRRLTWLLQTVGLFVGLSIYIIYDVVGKNNGDYTTSMLWGIANAVFIVLDFHFSQVISYNYHHFDIPDEVIKPHNFKSSTESEKTERESASEA